VDRWPRTPSATARFPGRWAAATAELRRGSPLVIDNIWSDGPTATAFREAAPPALTALLMYARALMLVPLEVRGRLIGFLLVDSDEPNRYGTRDAQLAWALANQAAIAVENARLYDQARRLATLEERQRLARELHDFRHADALHRVDAGACAAGRPARRCGAERRHARPPRRGHEAALAEMRTLLLELRPSAVLQADLPALMRQLAQGFRTHIERPVELELDCAGTLPMEVHLAFYRTARRRSATSRSTPPRPGRASSFSSARTRPRS
jgi:signal transduction histidine kinase